MIIAPVIVKVKVFFKLRSLWKWVFQLRSLWKWMCFHRCLPISYWHRMTWHDTKIFNDIDTIPIFIHGFCGRVSNLKMISYSFLISVSVLTYSLSSPDVNNSSPFWMSLSTASLHVRSDPLAQCFHWPIRFLCNYLANWNGWKQERYNSCHFQGVSTNDELGSYGNGKNWFLPVSRRVDTGWNRKLRGMARTGSCHLQSVSTQAELGS